MLHVVSSQPSSTSPYQPTETQETKNDQIPPRITRTESQVQDDCCCRADKSQGCFLYYCCNFFSTIFVGIANCTESFCDGCAETLTNCCEDKPDDRRQRIPLPVYADNRQREKERNRNIRKRYNTTYSTDYYNDDNTWEVDDIPNQTTDTVTGEPREYYSVTHSSTHHTDHHSNHHSNHQTNHCHDTSSGTHHNTGGICDSGGGGGGDSGGGDTGGGCDSGGGDTGGCDSGGCDSGGGGCDD